MRVLEEVGKRFDIAPQAMQQSFRTFAEISRLLRKGIEDVTVFLQSQGPVVSRWASQLQKDLASGLNPDQAYRRALEFMRRIRDPIERGMFAEKVFGNRQLGLVGSEDIGKLIDDVEKKLGRLPKGAAEAALEFKRTWDDFITSMNAGRPAGGEDGLISLSRGCKRRGDIGRRVVADRIDGRGRLPGERLMLLGREDAGAHRHGAKPAAIAREFRRGLRDLRVVFRLADDLAGAGGDLMPARG